MHAPGDVISLEKQNHKKLIKLLKSTDIGFSIFNVLRECKSGLNISPIPIRTLPAFLHILSTL